MNFCSCFIENKNSLFLRCSRGRQGKAGLHTGEGRLNILIKSGAIHATLLTCLSVCERHSFLVLCGSTVTSLAISIRLAGTQSKFLTYK
jgi:hypothetical protein